MAWTKATIGKLSCSGMLALLLFGSARAQNSYDVTPKPKAPSEKKNIDSIAFRNRFPAIAMSNWPRGMRLMVEPDENNGWERLAIEPYEPENQVSDGFDYGQYKIFEASDFALKTFLVDSIEHRTAGDYLILACDGVKYQHKISNDDHLEYFAPLDDIDSARNLLSGKKLYILTSQWLRNGVYADNAYRFLPVRVTKVGIGSPDGPVRIVFVPEGEEEAYIDVAWSGTNENLFDQETEQDFLSTFSFNDPKIRWRGVRKKFWNAIEHGRAVIGMSKAECTLAWGEPDNINTTFIRGHSEEQWVYGESSYLYFTDGVLTAIQD